MTYQQLVADLSPNLPYYGLIPEDIILSHDDIRLVVSEHGGKHFVAEALEWAGDDGTDCFDVIAGELGAPVPPDRARRAGDAVLQAVVARAQRQLCTDIIAHRDRLDGLRLRGALQTLSNEYAVENIVTGGRVGG